VGNRLFLEGAQDMNQSVDIAQVGEEGSLFKSFLADGGNVNVFDSGVGGFLGRIEVRELVEALVGDAGDADVRLARVGVGALIELGLGKDLEKRCLAYLRQADDASFHNEIRGPRHGMRRANWPLR